MSLADDIVQALMDDGIGLSTRHLHDKLGGDHGAIIKAVLELNETGQIKRCMAISHRVNGRTVACFKAVDKESELRSESDGQDQID